MTKVINSVRAQWAGNRRVLAVFLAPAALLLLAGLIVTLRLHVPLGVLTRDLAATARLNPFVGAISNIGILVWGAAATACFFTVALVRRTGQNTEFIEMFLVGGGVTLMLMLDDLFLLHETVFPDYLKVPEKLVYLTYGVVMLGFLVRFAEHILRTDYILLFAAFSFFGTSVIFDMMDLDVSLVFEDGTKLFGIVCWFSYFARTGYKASGPASFPKGIDLSAMPFLNSICAHLRFHHIRAARLAAKSHTRG